MSFIPKAFNSVQFYTTFDKVHRDYPNHTDWITLSGSFAYGIAHKDSDVDLRGIWVEPNNSLLTDLSSSGFNTAVTDQAGEHYDFTSHELNTFIKLMMKCNPNVLEVASCEAYTYMSRVNYLDKGGLDADATNDITKLLQAVYPLCLDADAIIKAYTGFAYGQINRMLRSGDDKMEDPKSKKLVRHAIRVLWQAQKLLNLGKPGMRLREPDISKLFSIGNCGSAEKAESIINKHIAEIKSFNEFCPAALAGVQRD